MSDRLKNGLFIGIIILGAVSVFVYALSVRDEAEAEMSEPTEIESNAIYIDFDSDDEGITFTNITIIEPNEPKEDN